MTEEQMYRKEKVCCSCKHFSSFMGSAGYCKAQDNKIEDMIDIMGTCHNGHYKYKRPTPKIVFKIQCWIYDIKYKTKRKFKKNEVSPLEDFDWDD